MAEFLLELFSEEIPARFQKQAAEDLAKLFRDALAEQNMAHTRLETYVTPRRLALVVEGLPLQQPDRVEEKKGPKVDAPAAAIEGFLKSAGLASLEACEQRDTPKGKIWFATTTVQGRPTADVLPELIEKTIRAFPWKKSQTWGTGSFQWVRPLRGIVALLDGKVLQGSFNLGGTQPALVFGNTTQGHRFMGSQAPIMVENFADYQAKLRANFVILDREERKKTIKDQAQALLAAEGLTLKEDEGLLEEVCGLVEYPVPLLGSIDAHFMSIPSEVLVTTMRNNQKYFAALDAAGTMSPRIVIVANIVAPDAGATIVGGNERVLRARFSDAQFFWDQDRKQTLFSRKAGLSAVTFHAKLGNVLQKIERVENLAATINEETLHAKDAEVRRAAALAKCDLLTGMVGEFPELQGIMGGYYARHDGEAAAVATAITEHYSPLGPHDACPTAPLSIAVALADKLDTLVGFFGIDEKPTGSKDPYALRRAALGILRLIIENKLRLNLGVAIKAAYEAYGNLPTPHAQVEADILAFFADRLKVMLRDRGYRHDVVSALFNPHNVHDVIGQMGRLDVLQATLESSEGKALLALYRRAANILRIEEKKDNTTFRSSALEVGSLKEAEEKALCDALTRTAPEVAEALKADQHSFAMQRLLTLRAPLDAFFDKVTVNADDAAVRVNRLRLLAQVRETMHRMADLSQIEGE